MAAPLRRSSTVTRMMSDIKLTDFDILGKLGEGGFGTVLLSRLKATGTLVAIKLLLKRNLRTRTQAERVVRESKAMLETGHPYIVQLHGAFQDEQYVYFVLEYMGGGDLFSHMNSIGTALKEEQAVLIAAETALALEHLHALGYMYRDLKTENLLVANDGHLKLADFGLVKKFRESGSDVRPTTPLVRRDTPTEARPEGTANAFKMNGPRHSRVGTPDAVAPEIMGVGTGGSKDYGASVDWWAFGILIAELLIVDSPLRFNGETDEGMLLLIDSYRHETHLRDDFLSRVLSASALDVVQRLLTVVAGERLCCGRNGSEALRGHPFFANVDWKALAKKEGAPPLPPIDAPFSPRGPIIKTTPGHEEAIQTVVDNIGEFLNAPEGELCDLAAADGHAGALCTAACNGDTSQLRTLIAQGVDVNEGDYDQRTALHLAASEGLLEVVQYLVCDAKADPSPIDRWGGTPLDDAIRSSHQSGLGHHATIVFLKASGAKRGATAFLRAKTMSADLCAAAHSGDVATLRRLVREDNVDADLGDYDSRTAMHLAASEGHVDVVEALVAELGAYVNPRDRWGNTPLDDACRSGLPAVAERLRAAGGTSGADFVGFSEHSGRAFSSSTHSGRAFSASDGGSMHNGKAMKSFACVLL